MRFKGISVREDHLLATLVVAVSTTSFLLGRMSVDENAVPTDSVQAAGVSMNAGEGNSSQDLALPVASTPVEGGYVASKSGTKYHLPWCAGAKQIKEENKIWFTTKEEAEKAGYSPAANCKGI